MDYAQLHRASGYKCTLDQFIKWYNTRNLRTMKELEK